MKTFQGEKFDGRQPVGIAAEISIDGQEATVIAEHFIERYPIKLLKVSPRIALSPRFISLPGGSQFMCADDDYLDSLPQESYSEGPVAWLEKQWGFAVVCVFAIFTALAIAYFFGLPIAAKRAAVNIPIKTERRLGQETISWLDQSGWFNPTAIDQERREIITREFINLNNDLPLKGYYCLEFRSGKKFGANALALPGGSIIITDEMVNTAQSNEELMAILAHEIGHIELRHIMRNVLQNSVIAVAAATLTTDAASLSTAVSGIPAFIAQAKYSREFESEADEYAFKLLKKKGYSPEAFAAIMERLTQKQNSKYNLMVYVSSHPSTLERINRAHAAAKD